MTNESTLQRIAREETNRFIDDNFGQLDISGCPSLLIPPSENSQLPDERFAPLDDRGLGASALKRSIEQLATDPEVQEQVAMETGNPELIESYLDQNAEAVSREFMRKNPSYHRCTENWEKLVQTIAYNSLGWAEDESDVDEAQDELARRGLWSLESLNAAFNALSRAGVLLVRPDQPRNLTEQQRRALALQAGSGDVDGAISRYLLMRAPEDIADVLLNAPTLSDALDEIANPAMAKIVSEAVWFCWEQGRPNYSATHDRRRFMREYIAGRIPTARLLDEAWAACQAEEKDALRDSVLGQAREKEESVPDLDGLTDDEVQHLYRGTLRKVALDSRRASPSVWRTYEDLRKVFISRRPFVVDAGWFE
jgi:hypothetical protein